MILRRTVAGALLTLLLFFATAAGAGERSGIPTVLARRVSADSLRLHVAALADAGGWKNRVTFTPGSDSATRHIARSFAAAPRAAVLLDTLPLQGVQPPYTSIAVCNVVATLSGSDTTLPPILLGAHLDCSADRTPGWTTDWATMSVPGADDNATGVAAVLECARIFGDTASGYRNRHTLIFVAFAAEEWSKAASGSLVGSRHCAGELRLGGRDLTGMINLDMLGYNADHLYADICADGAARTLGDAFTEANAELGSPVGFNAAPYSTFGSSDHVAFREQGYPAMMIIEHAPPWQSGSSYAVNALYHTSYDTTGALNFSLVEAVTRVTVGAITILDSAASPSFVAQRPVPATPELGQNYPNPFNGTTLIPLPGGSRIGIEIVDLLGRRVAQLESRGASLVRFDGAGLAPGVYFYRIAGSAAPARKMVLLP